MGGEFLQLSDTPLHDERVWEADGIAVLRAEVTLPRCGEKGRRARRFDRYYRRYARAYLRYCEGELLPRAAEQMRSAMERSAPWKCAQVTLGYTVTLTRGGLLSLYTEGREEHLPPRLTIRRAETWDMRRGLLLPLADFFPPKTAVKRLLVRSAWAQAASQIDEGSAAYYPSYRAALRRCFSAHSFYLTPEGLHWFYPMYSAASAAEGIADFCLPYGEGGPLLPEEA